MNKEQKIIILAIAIPLLIMLVVMIFNGLHHPEKGFVWEWHLKS